jgi:hypothetical protein
LLTTFSDTDGVPTNERGKGLWIIHTSHQQPGNRPSRSREQPLINPSRRFSGHHHNPNFNKNARNKNLPPPSNTSDPEFATPSNPLPEPLSVGTRSHPHNTSRNIRLQQLVNTMDLALRQRPNGTLSLCSA